MDLLHGLRAYSSYLFKAKGPHGIHSPFIYGLILNVLKNHQSNPHWNEIEKRRASLLKSVEAINVIDYGAGSKVLTQSNRKVNQIASSAVSPVKYCKLLNNLVIYCGSKRVLEFGTSLGISTAYLSLAAEHVTTLEGDPNTAEIARNTWNVVGTDNIELMQMEFDNALNQLELREPFDFVFIDGHHKKEATLKYLERVMPLLTDEAVVVLDDINWSIEMQQAWKIAQSSVEFSMSVDLFRMGLLFKRVGVEKQHFILRF